MQSRNKVVGAVSLMLTVIGAATEGLDWPGTFHLLGYTWNAWLVGAGLAIVGGLVWDNQVLRLALRPKLRVECGNILGEFLKKWYGPGATEHLPILLLRIQNVSASRPVKGCRAQVWFDPWDEQRFDPLPRDLPWWRGYEQYIQGDRPLEMILAPGGSGWVVLVDDSDIALKLRPFDIDDEDREYVDAAVVAWGEIGGKTERHFRVTWDDASQVPTITATDGGPPCVDEIPPSAFFAEPEESG